MMHQNQNQLSLQSLKLIFNEGNINSTLTKEAIDVCRLLAIDPQDVVHRDISEFKLAGYSAQRAQLRYEYYQEKKYLKLKAIENIILKTQKGQNGHLADDAKQVLSLLEDVKHIRMGTQKGRNGHLKTPPKRNHAASSSNLNTGQITNQNRFEAYSSKSVNLPVPSLGSTANEKSRKALDKLPKNLIEKEKQEKMINVMRVTFMTDPSMGEAQDKAKNSEHRRSNKKRVFDTYTHGFDLPAAQQLNRINWKLNRWQKTQNNIEQRKAEQQMAQKQMELKINKKQQKTERQRQEIQNSVFTRVQERQELWSTKIQKYKQDLKTYESEISRDAKKDFQVWQETLQEHQKNEFRDPSPKKKRPDELVAENYLQTKGKEQEIIQKSYQDYENAKTDLDGLSQKLSKSAERYHKIKSDLVNQVNSHIQYVDERKQYKYNLDEKKTYQNLNQVIQKDKKFNKTIQKLNKDQKYEEFTKNEKSEQIKQRAQIHQQNLVQKHKAEFNQVQSRMQIRMEKEKQASEIKRQKTAQLAEKRKMKEIEAQQNLHTMKLMRNVKAYKVYEKHMIKEKYIHDLNTQQAKIEKQKQK